MSKKVHRDGWVNLQRTRRRFKFPWITDGERETILMLKDIESGRAGFLRWGDVRYLADCYEQDLHLEWI